MQSIIVRAAGLMGTLAIALGAFGAHAMRARLDARGQTLWQLASTYLLFHAAALLALAALVALGAARPHLQAAAAVAWIGGTVLFSGSLYALAAGAPSSWGAITPVGGLSLLAGWLLLALSARS